MGSRDPLSLAAARIEREEVAAGRGGKKSHRRIALADVDREEEPLEDTRTIQEKNESFRRQARRRSQITENRNHLQSDVPVEEVVEHICFLQSCGVGFKDFDSDEVQSLAEALSVMKFDEDEKVVEKGETGTWFGVLVSGTLKARAARAQCPSALSRGWHWLVRSATQHPRAYPRRCCCPTSW